MAMKQSGFGRTLPTLSTTEVSCGKAQAMLTLHDFDEADRIKNRSTVERLNMNQS